MIDIIGMLSRFLTLRAPPRRRRTKTKPGVDQETIHSLASGLRRGIPPP